MSSFMRRAAIPCFGQLLICLIVIVPARAQTCNDVELRSQAEVDAFDCTWVGNLTIGAPGNEDNISDLSPLAGLTTVVKYLRIRNNDSLTSLEGLGALQSVGEASQGTGGLEIVNNLALITLEGFNSLNSVYGLRIDGNESLTSLEGLESLSFIPQYGGISIVSNPSLVALSGLDSLTYSFNLHIENNDALESLAGLEELTTVGGSVEQGGGLTISGNAALVSLEGIENLTAIGGGNFGGLVLSENDALLSLAALGGLDYIGGNLVIDNNDALASLTGLEGVESLGGDLRVENNDVLKSLAGLEGIVSVGPAPENGAGNLTISNNDSLESLEGLGNIALVRGDPIGTSLNVVNNDVLRRCSCGLSGLIAGDPPAFTGVQGDVVIEENDPEGTCTSPEVVLATPCEPVANEEGSAAPQELQLESYPNPAAESFTVRYALPEAGPVRLAVYDLLGREVTVLDDSVRPVSWHEARIGGLAAGVYLVRMEVGQEVRTQRVTVLR